MASTMEVLVAGFRLAARLETETAPAHASPLLFLYAPPRPAAPPADSRVSAPCAIYQRRPAP